MLLRYLGTRAEWQLLLASYTTSRHAGKFQFNIYLLLSVYYHLQLGDSQSRLSFDYMRFLSLAESNKSNTDRILQSCASQAIDQIVGSIQVYYSVHNYQHVVNKKNLACLFLSTLFYLFICWGMPFNNSIDHSKE